MSAEATEMVWRKAPYSSLRLAVLLAMADFADERGECQVTLKAIGVKTRISDVRRVRRLLAEFETDGWIVRQPHYTPHGDNAANRYIVCPGMLGAKK